MVFIESVLEKSGIFKGIDIKSNHDVLDLIEIIQVEKDDKIINENDDIKDIYILASGKLAVCKIKDSIAFELHEINKVGEIVGEIASLCDQKRTATILAKEKSTLLKINPSLLGESSAGQMILKNIAVNGLRKIDFANKAHLDALEKERKLLAERVENGLLFVTVVLGFTLSVICNGVMNIFHIPMDRLASWVLILIFLIPVAYFIHKQSLPLKTMGFTTKNLKNSLLNSVKWSALSIIVVLVSVYILTLFTKHPITHYLSYDYLFDVTQPIYFFHCLLQELIARGCIQSSIKKLLNDSKGGLSIVVGSMIFSSFHAQFGLFVFLATFLSGLVFGYIYNKDQNLAGVSLLHYVLGTIMFIFLYAK
jgi:membrane protease YdiL (CAAX protease family)/CRP-like cAMP-binding protein